MFSPLGRMEEENLRFEKQAKFHTSTLPGARLGAHSNSLWRFPQVPLKITVL